MMKGHTKIELTNVHTGEKKVVEDDNLVTNAIKYFLNNLMCPPYTQSNVGDNIMNDADKWFGGLLLFRDTIEEDADNCLIPSDNQMIGNARVNYASASGVPEFGAYNSEESTYTIEGGKITRKFVYDFGTSKGNGTISCVALTNIHAGYWGAGNTSGKYEALTVDGYNYNYNDTRNGTSDYNLYSYNRSGITIVDSDGKKFSDSINDKKEILFADYKSNSLYFVDANNICYDSSHKDRHFTKTGKLRLYKATYPLKSYNPLSATTIGKDSYPICRIYETIDVIVPDELKTYNNNIMYNYCNPSVTNDGVWLVFYNNSTKSFMCWFISADLKTTKYVNVKNTAGTIALQTYFSYLDQGNVTKNRSFVIYKNYLLCYRSDNTDEVLYAIDMNDNTNVFQFEIIGEKFNSDDYINNFIIIDDQLFLNVNKRQYQIDITNKVLKRLNGVHYITSGYSGYSGFNYNTILQICGTNKYVLWTSNDRGSRGCFMNIYPNVFMLSTINNLPEPVTKTNDMTMKITYTLTSDL